MAGQSGVSHKDDIVAMAAMRASPMILPALAVAALLCGIVVYMAVQDTALAGGFVATLLAMAALVWMYRRMVIAPVNTKESLPDWSVARAAADASHMAIAVTDRAGKLVCASDLYGEWFPGFPAPPSVPLDGLGRM